MMDVHDLRLQNRKHTFGELLGPCGGDEEILQTHTCAPHAEDADFGTRRILDEHGAPRPAAWRARENRRLASLGRELGGNGLDVSLDAADSVGRKAVSDVEDPHARTDASARPASSGRKSVM